MITIQAGINNEMSVSVSDYPTAMSVTNSPQLKAALQFGDNVECRINGMAFTGSFQDGDHVKIVTKSNDKG
tara:strand:+ start:639 stop:851 length:213 start_codon:yes stop_codon:yes gene_type:complete